MIKVLESMPPPAELGVLFERSIKVRESTILACLTLHGHEFGVHGSQDVDRTLIHIPLGVRYPFSRDDDLWLPGLAEVVLRELKGSPSSGLSSLRRSGLSHLFQPRHSSDFRGLGEDDLPSALLP